MYNQLVKFYNQGTVKDDRGNFYMLQKNGGNFYMLQKNGDQYTFSDILNTENEIK